MFGKGKDGMPDDLKAPASVQSFHSAAPAPAAAVEGNNAVSSISAGMTVVGKISGSGSVKILGRVEGELRRDQHRVGAGLSDLLGDLLALEHVARQRRAVAVEEHDHHARFRDVEALGDVQQHARIA